MLHIVRGGQAASLDDLGDEVIQAVFHDGRETVVDRLDLAGVYVDGDDGISITRETTRGDDTDIADAEHADTCHNLDSFDFVLLDVFLFNVNGLWGELKPKSWRGAVWRVA